MKQQAGAQGSMDEREAAALQKLIQDGKVTEKQVELFRLAHDKLANAGLMP